MTNTRAFRTLSLSVVAAAALTLSACGGGEAAPEESEAAPAQSADSGEAVPTAESTESADSADSSADSAQSRGGDLDDARTAVQTAEDENGGTAHSLDFDDNDLWEVTVLADGTEWEYDISTDGSTIERTDEDTEDDADDQRELDQAEVTLIEALETALEDTPGTIDDIDLDEDDGTLRWDVSIHPEGDSGEQEIEVDAASGDIVSSRHDGDDDGDDDDD
ncbi:MAG TPA: PepSY domain-containing protein [Brevibacterium senegalense]|uniref:PepSY domain-containing protein n=1 Tax=Brevibacterium senegalense TaxID=1033736 RepID=A0A921SN01_9MICO|nr:PepSY domain-containing protein [Brevibacterium senegalense]